ncbi:universal stress protein YxiE-like isoform X1 [Styela clava]
MAQKEQQTGTWDGVTRRILIAVDDSENSLAAFDYYVKHVNKPGDQLIAFHVSDQVKMPTYALFSDLMSGITEGVGFSPDQMMAMIDELREKNKALEAKYNKKCSELEIKHKCLIVSEDPHGPGHAICDSAKKHNADMIIVGSRGLGTLRRTILGSVSTYVIHHSHIPTLVCPVGES